MVPEVFGCADLLDGVLLRGNNLGSNLGKNVMHRKKLKGHIWHRKVPSWDLKLLIPSETSVISIKLGVTFLQ